MTHIFKVLAVTIGIGIGLVSCAPRGESISVEQAYQNAQERFVEAKQSAQSSLAPEVKSKVETLQASLDKFGSFTEVAQLQAESASIAATLLELLPMAGYQNRPSIDELRKEYLNTSVQTSYGTAVDAVAKNLGMRTYHILSTELEGTRFKVEPL